MKQRLGHPAIRAVAMTGKGVTFPASLAAYAAGTLRYARLLRASPGCPSMDTRSAGRSDASPKDTAEPLCLGWRALSFIPRSRASATDN